jgi:TPR repeat protein
MAASWSRDEAWTAISQKGADGSRAAEVGMVDAQVALGEMMLTGTGGACDPPGALALFEKAAANGHLAAMFATSVVYGGVHGVPANHGAAQHWFRAAAEHGHPAAQMMLERHVTANAADQADPDDVRHRPGKAPAEGPNEAGEDVLRHPRKLQAIRQYRSRVNPRSTHFDAQVEVNRLAHFECGTRASPSCDFHLA